MACPRTDGPRRAARRLTGVARRRPGRRRACSRPHRLLPVAARPRAARHRRRGRPERGRQRLDRRRHGRRRADHPRRAAGRQPRPGPGLRRASSRPKTDSLCAGAYELDDRDLHARSGRRAGRAQGAPRRGPGDRRRRPQPVAPARETRPCPTDAEIVRDEGGSALTPGAPALIPDAAPGEADFVMGSARRGLRGRRPHRQAGAGALPARVRHARAGTPTSSARSAPGRPGSTRSSTRARPRPAAPATCAS